jgi:glycosyltransferase involved in cell wall biosynthesis
MIPTNLHWDQEDKGSDTAAAERRSGEIPTEGTALNGTLVQTENRLNGLISESRTLNGQASKAKARRTLAVFCYEESDSILGRSVSQTAAALAQRHTAVHLFVRQSQEHQTPGVIIHAVGECPGDDLPQQVQEFGRRACNAFLQQFPAGSENVTSLGYEWSSVPALSVLQGIRNAATILSLHSLERQRCGMTSAISKQIEEVELTGLRQARTILIHEPATAEVAKYWLPECADRLVAARQPFPIDHFEDALDPGAVKARYQVGPVDPTILFVGDLEERYGPDLLVKALPAVLKNNKQARLIIVGDGSLYWPLRVYARYLLLEHAVRLAGSVEGPALYELIQAADVITVPSRESTPWWPILAAWAARRPVVASHEAARGLVEHEQDSVLFYPNENSCVWGIERVLFDPELGRTISRKGRHKLEERFGWNAVAAQVEELMGVSAGR